MYTKANGTVLASETYTRNAGGEPSKVTREDGSYTLYEYDGAVRLSKETSYTAAGVAIRSISYSYDLDGKRTRKVDNLGTADYTYNANGQLTTAGQNGYVYDVDGRLSQVTKSGNTVSLSHDAYDHLTQVTNNGVTTQYLYDASGNRIGEVSGNSSKNYLVAPNVSNGLASTDLVTDNNGNVVSDYVYGGSNIIARLDASGEPIYYLTDSMGSVIGLVDGDGNIQSRIIYDGFGNVVSGDDGASLGGDFRFQGQWLESESGIYYMRARDYDAETGLFLSRDPVDMQAQGVEAFNPYQFAFNNPLVFSDPSGLVTITEINASLELDKILRSIETRTKQELFERIKDQALQAAGEAFWSGMGKFVPQNYKISPLTQAIKALDEKNGGLQFEQDFKRETAKALSQSGVDSSQIFLEVGVNPETGYANGNYIQFPNIKGNIKVGEKRPDFVLTPPRSKPIENRQERNELGRSYVIGDFKLQLKTIINAYIGTPGNDAKNPEQWDAISLYARKNGYRIAAFITLFGASKTKQQDMFEQIAQKAAIKKGFVVFIVSILPNVGFNDR